MSTQAITRPSGRKPKDLRPVTISRAFTKHAEGSVLIAFGDTKVLCTASILDKVPPHKRGSGEGWVTAEYGMLPRSTHTRSDREAARGKQSGRTQEIQRLIGRAMRSIFNLQILGERTIHLDCDVLQAGTLTQDPIIDSVAAISVGIYQGTAVLDLDYPEDSSCDTDMNVVMTGKGGMIEVQGTAEGAAFSRPELNALLDLAEQGIQELTQLQIEALK